MKFKSSIIEKFYFKNQNESILEINSIYRVVLYKLMKCVIMSVKPRIHQIENGGNIFDQKNKAIILAIKQGHFQIVKYLIENGMTKDILGDQAFVFDSNMEIRKIKTYNLLKRHGFNCLINQKHNFIQYY